MTAGGIALETPPATAYGLTDPVVAFGPAPDRTESRRWSVTGGPPEVDSVPGSTGSGSCCHNERGRGLLTCGNAAPAPAGTA
jgi:hypothetical protein